MDDSKLLCCIVDRYKGSKVLRTAKKAGITGGTVFFGKGTINNRILEVLGLNDCVKEIVIMAADSLTAVNAAQKIVKEHAFHKPGHGIAFITSLTCVFGCSNIKPSEKNINKEDTVMYQSVITIVDKGNADDVIEAAKAAGARGATVINARGSGVHETEVVFAMPIEPEKEIVLIITEKKSVENIVTSIREKVGIDEPGKGVLFVSSLDAVYGLYS